MLGKGITIPIDQVTDELKTRDYRDKTRSIAPLVQAPDARLLDTSNIGIDASIDIVFRWVQEVLVLDE